MNKEKMITEPSPGSLVYMEQCRELKKIEIDLIEYLARKAKYPLVKNWYNKYKALPMNDGGMGSIILIPDNLPQQDRFFNAQISDCLLKDIDNMDILISLNIDQNDFLFELDIWKCDYSPVKEITGIEDLRKMEIMGFDTRGLSPCVQ